MAITTITPVQLVKDTMSADLPVGSFTAIVAADTHKIAFPKENKLIIVINNTFAGAKVITFVAGVFQGAGVGNLDLSLAQDDVRFIAVSSDRFKDADGNLQITVAAGTTGFIGAFYMP